MTECQFVLFACLPSWTIWFELEMICQMDNNAQIFVFYIDTTNTLQYIHETTRTNTKLQKHTLCYIDVHLVDYMQIRLRRKTNALCIRRCHCILMQIVQNTTALPRRVPTL
jgi:hypothetical protein